MKKYININIKGTQTKINKTILANVVDCKLKHINVIITNHLYLINTKHVKNIPNNFTHHFVNDLLFVWSDKITMSTSNITYWLFWFKLTLNKKEYIQICFLNEDCNYPKTFSSTIQYSKSRRNGSDLHNYFNRKSKQIERNSVIPKQRLKRIVNMSKRLTGSFKKEN